MLFLGMAHLASTQCRWEKVHDLSKGEVIFTFELNGAIYIGFEGVTDNFYKYDLAKDTLVPRADFKGSGLTSGYGPSPMYTTLDGKGYLMFAADSVEASKTMWEYNPDQDEWQAKAKFPGANRGGVCGCSLKGKIYFGLGSINGNFQKDWYAYDPELDSFIVKNSFPNLGRLWSDCMVVNERFFILGGEKDNLDRAEDIWEYLPEKDSFRKVLQANKTVSGGDNFVLNGKGYIKMGAIYQFDPDAETLQVYDRRYPTRSFGLGVSLGGKGYFVNQSRIYAYDPFLPRPQVTLQDTTKCRNDTLVLDVENPMASYQWSTGDTTRTIAATELGSYTVTVTDSNECTATDTAHISSIVNLKPDTTICRGDPLNLDAGHPGATYNWNTNETTQTIEVKDSGEYFVEVDDEGCLGSDTIEVDAYSNPEVDLGPDTVFCSGKSYALKTGLSGTDHIWQDSSGGSSYVAEEPGEYRVRVIDENGCADRDTVALDTFPRPPQPAVEKIGEDSLRSSRKGAHYRWFLDGNNLDLDQRIIATRGEGDYRVTIENEQGCVSKKSDTFSRPSGIAEVEKSPFKVYPNPVERQLVIEDKQVDDKALQIELVSMEGRLVHRQKMDAFQTKIEIDIRPFNSGVYQLKLIGEEGVWLKQVVMQ